MAQQGRQGRPGGRGMEMNMDSLKAQLNLTEDQVVDFQSINESSRAKRREIFQSSEGDREAMREAMTALRAESNQLIKDILTMEQWTKYEAIQAKMRENRAGRPEGGDRQKKKKTKSKDTDTDL